MGKVHRWTARAAVVGIIASSLLFASAYPGARVAGSLMSAATAPTLGTAASFGVLGGSTVTNTGATTITGDLGVSPGSAITGFPPGIATGTTHRADAGALQAQTDVTTAYNNLAGQTCDADLTGQDLGGKTLTPGVYCFSSSAGLTGALTLDAQGNASAVWVFKMGSTLTTASNSSVIITNGGQDCNVFWQVGSSATLGTGTTFIGNILALTSITVTTGASVSGRALARNGAVTLDTNTISATVCAAATATPTPTVTPLPATATAIAATATAIAALTPTATPLPATATAIAATATAIAAATATAAPPSGGSCGTGQVDITKRLEDQNGKDLGLAENLPRLELVLGANHIKAEVIGLGTVRFSGLGKGTWEIWENGAPTGKTTDVGCDTATATVLFNRVRIEAPAPVEAAETAVPAPPAATPVLTTPTATSVPATPAATPVPSKPQPTVTPRATLTPTVVMPATLPSTGDPSGLVTMWLGLGGAGVALLGFSMRRRSR